MEGGGGWVCVDEGVERWRLIRILKEKQLKRKVEEKGWKKMNEEGRAEKEENGKNEDGVMKESE